MIETIVSGARGRIGSLILAEIAGLNDIKVVGSVGNPKDPLVGSEIFSDVVLQASLEQMKEQQVVLVEFSTPQATINHLPIAIESNWPVIIGTTGFTEEQESIIQEASKKIPVLTSHNFGIGMNAFWEILKVATAYLGNDFDIEIVEFHAAAKPDVPSGTGKTIASIIATERGDDLNQVVRYGREQNNAFKRKPGEIGIHSLRAGSYRSDHTVIFAGNGERLEFTHREEDSKIIAQGVCWAIRFLDGQPPGFYGMQHVLQFIRDNR